VTSRAGVVVLDDHFPTKGTGFRIAEFDWLMRHGVVAEVMTTVTPLEPLLADYSAIHPQTYRQIRGYDPERLGDFECASVLFLNNAAYFLPDLERHDLPFVLTLYPGGGLNLGDAEAEAKLAKVLASPQLRHLITTQPVVTEHVRSLVAESVPVTEVLGLAVDPLYLTPGPGYRTDYFGGGKEHLDVCFVAHRYTEDGADKGFPVFLEVVARLQADGVPVRGHVVGGYGPAQVPAEHSGLELTYAGVMSTPELREFFLGMDLILSPASPGRLATGSFDGFPTGACVEAALSGVAVLATDPLGQNRLFKDRRDIHMPAADAAAIVSRIQGMLAEPDGVRRVAQAGLRTARRAYGVQAQLWTRRQVIESVRSAAGQPPAD
jgi:glycosyltransferase involved in cell wall biosynthesis